MWPPGPAGPAASPEIGSDLYASIVTMQSALAAGAALVALGFAMATFERWLAGRRRHELAWSVSLLLFSLGAFPQFGISMSDDYHGHPTKS